MTTRNKFSPEVRERAVRMVDRDVSEQMLKRRAGPTLRV